MSVMSVFNKAALYPDAANMSLLQAVEGKAGANKEVKDLLKEAVAGLLNAYTTEINYPLSAEDIVVGVNMVLTSGDNQSMKSLKGLLKEANDAKGCK